MKVQSLRHNLTEKLHIQTDNHSDDDENGDDSDGDSFMNPLRKLKSHTESHDRDKNIFEG